MDVSNKNVLPILTFLVVVGCLGLSYFGIHETTENDINLLLLVTGSFGMGGIYLKAIREGFSKYQETKNRPTSDSSV